MSRFIGPHRAYRTLRFGRGHVAAAIAWLVVVESLVYVLAPRIAAYAINAGVAALRWGGIAVDVIHDDFLSYRLPAIAFALPSLDYVELLGWIAGGLIATAIVTQLRWIATPMRYFLNLNFLMLVAEGTYLLFAGRLGYSSTTFSVLIVRTILAGWFVIPFFTAAIAALLPFSAGSMGALIFCALVYDVVLATVRYAAFIAILSLVGPIAMANLYLLYGPLLDVVPIVGLYAIFLTRLSRQLGGPAEAWGWL
jgi:hypothetical protein